MLARLSLRVRMFLFFAALAFGAIGAVAVGLWLGYRRLGDPETLGAFVQGGTVGGFAILGLTAWVWYLFDANVAKPIDTLSGALRARAHSDATGEVNTEIARYLGDLAPAARAAATSLDETRNALAEAVGRETTRLAAEKERLEALLSDVPVGVLLCSADHQLVFYNGQAVELIGAASGTPGLDRKLFDYLRAGPIRLAYDRLVATGDEDAASDLLAATLDGGQVLAARMRLLPVAAGAAPGYVLTLRDVTGDLAQHARREALVEEIFDRLRRPAANLATLMGVLPEGEAPPARMERALRDEVAALSAAITDLGLRHEEGRSEGWPLVLTRASDLMDGLRARLEAHGHTVDTRAAPLMLRCNGFEVIGLLDRLATGLAGDGIARAFHVVLDEDGAGAMIRLEWAGAPLSVARLEHWLAEPLESGAPHVTGRSVLAALAAWLEASR